MYIPNNPNRLSPVLDALRFPMIVLVLFMHVIPLDANIVPLEWSWASLYLFVTEFVAHNLGRIAVPIFFLISGYLFFLKAPEQFESSFFLNQWRKRLTTLLVPYLLWNTLKYLAIGTKGLAMQKLGFSADGDWDYFLRLDPYHIFYSPLNEPLWYLRDLIWMVVLSPIFFLVMKHLRHWGLLIIALWYLSAWELGITGLSLVAIFYFGLGAFYSINKRDMLQDFTSLKFVPLLISLCVIAVGTLVSNEAGSLKEHWLRPALILGVIGVFYPTRLLLDTSQRFSKICLSYAGSVFFIYAVHEIYLKNWINGFFSRLPMMDHYGVKLIGYIAQPIILLALCLVINFIVKRYLPKIYAVLTGGRL